MNVDLSLAKLYQLYKEEANNPVSQSYYNNIFYTNFNLRFKKPKKDTCHKCDFFIIKINSSSGAEREIYEECHRIHLECAESLRSQMGRDIAAAKLDKLLEVLAFDMQKILMLPNIPTSIIYYLRQLNLYNFGIHTGSTGRGKFNIWTEGHARSRLMPEITHRQNCQTNRESNFVVGLMWWAKPKHKTYPDVDVHFA